MLDEPTTGLDPLMQEEFLAVIGRVPRARRHGLPVLARPRRGRAGLRPGRDHPRGTARRGRERSPTCAAARTTTYRSSSTHRSTARSSARIPGVSELEADGAHVLVQGHRAPGPGGQGRRPPHRARHGADRADARGDLPHLLRTRGRGMSVDRHVRARSLRLASVGAGLAGERARRGPSWTARPSPRGPDVGPVARRATARSWRRSIPRSRARSNRSPRAIRVASRRRLASRR